MRRLAFFFLALVLVVIALSNGSNARQGAPFNPHGGYSASTNNCTSCHQPHKTTRNPEAACTTCHPTVQTHQQQACAECHDPHGQTGNAALIQASLGGKNVSFNGANFDGPGNAICEVCHTTTQYHSATAKNTHYENQDCTNCHPHSAGFDADPTSCSACHGNPPAQDAHARHFQADIGVDNCSECHPTVRNWRDPGHRNGRVDFVDRAALATTGVCNECHGNQSGIAEAKANWRSARAISDCTGCHNSADPAKLDGKAAPAVDAFWAKNGHGQGHEQDEDLDCQACHNPKAPHFDGSGGARLWSAANTLCAGCHNRADRPGPDVSAHGNQGFALATQKPFVAQCATCHDPHGSSNLAAIRESVDGSRVALLNRTGDNSFDSPNDNNSRDLCATCHSSTAHNRTPSNRGQSPHYEGQDCARCHKHETDGDPKTADAFMAKADCMDCHNGAVDNGDNIPPGGRPSVGDQFDGRSHHIKGELTSARCTVCHDMTTHGDGYVDLKMSSGAPLRFVNARSTDLTSFCQGCHTPGGSKIGAAPGGSANDPFGEGSNLGALALTSTHNNQSYHASQEGPFRAACSDCHNGHGSDNLALVLNSINGNRIVFTARTGAGSFDDPNGDDRNDICVTCHLGRTSVHPGGDHRPAGDLDLRGTDCTTCHLHDANNDLGSEDAFMPSCNACHGQPPPPAGSGYAFNETLTPHQKHAGVGQGQYGLACSTCHNRLAPGYTGHVTNPPSFQDVFFDGRNPAGSFNRANRTCANVGCHSNGSPSTGQTVFTTPAWAENARLSCNGCHGDQNTIMTGSHSKHLLLFYRDRGDKSIGCYECHSNTAQNNNNEAVASTANHVNSSKDVKFDVSEIWGNADKTIFSTGNLTCANSLCHSDGAASRQVPGKPTFATPKWGDANSGACGTCHAVSAQTLTTGAHARHFDSSNQGPGISSCDTCHASYGAATHVDGKVEFVDGKTLYETAACDQCHSPGGAFNGVVEARNNWGAKKPVSCEGCHDAQPSQIKGVSAANIEGDGATYGLSVSGHGKSLGSGCALCHAKQADSIHFDGKANTYDAEANNYAQAKWLTLGGLNIPIGLDESYQTANYAMCFACHSEAQQVGLAEGYSNALSSHSSPPPPGYPLSVPDMATRFRNERVEGFNFGNVPANIHWDHLDMNAQTWDSDGDGAPDSKPNCVTCHDPHGVKSYAAGVNYPAMTHADMGLTYGQDSIGAFGEVTKSDYNKRCTSCHATSGLKYYRP